MKKLLPALFFFLFTASAAVAQISIRGNVTDSLKREPLSYVTVTLKNSQTDKAVKSILTNEGGNFQIKEIPAQPLQLVLSFVGYQTKLINLAGKTGDIDLGHILLSPSNGQLKEVTVQTAKPLLKREIDRLSYDVQADPDNKTFNTLDIMRKVPLLSVDGYEKIKLKGSGSFKILINGRESAITAHSPEEALKSMPATSVERIEVITTPPAKYDGEGLAGIINIVTKKNTDQGYNVNSNLRYKTVNGGLGNSSVTVKNGKFGVTGFVSYSYRGKLTNGISNIRETFAPVKSTLSQDGEGVTGKGSHVEDIVNISYDIDSLNLLTAGYVNYFENSLNQLSQTAIEHNANGLLTQQYHSFDDGSYRNNSTSAEFNYQHGFKQSKTQLLTVGYKFDNGDYSNKRDVHFSDQVNFGSADYRQPSQINTREYTAQIDYAQPLNKFALETGLKAIFRENHSSYGFSQLNGSDYVDVPTLSNRFTYQQRVYSAYSSGQFTSNKFLVKAGLRLEHTQVDADFASSAQSLAQRYTTLLPTLSLQRKFKNSDITLGAANRLMRPNIWDLNPFVDRSNPKFLTTGNPELRPIILHSFEFNYTNQKLNNLNLGLSYQTTNNNIENVRTIQTDTVTFRQPKNLGKLKYLTLTASMNISLTKKWQLNTNAEGDYVSIKGEDNGLLMENQGYQANVSLDTSYQFNKGWRVSATGSYYTGYVEFQGNSNKYLYSSFRVSKELLNKKLLINVTANNPYNARVMLHGTGFSPEFYRNEYFNDYYRTIAFSINYKFGRLASDIKKSQRNINNDDLRSGGKG